MSVLRNLLLAGSQSTWLRRQATRRAFVRRAVSRFMPGETPDEALAAAARLEARGFGVILTHLGENVLTRAEAEAETRHYLDLVGRIRAAGLHCEVSIKLTQLGLDLERDFALANTRAILTAAASHGFRVWIDMEDSRYPEATLEVYRALRAEARDLGVAIQSYLRRTPADIEALIPVGAVVRMVKGAYSEPPSIAFPDKRDVDETFFQMSARLLSDEARARGAWLAAGTHDRALVERIARHARERGLPSTAFEYAMLYGIQPAEQERLVREGYPVKVLISYGSYWFPWYMRRLAERPANLLFVFRNVLRR